MYVILPHSSSGAGSLLAMNTAAGLNSAGLMRLFTNGARRVTGRPALHAAEVTPVKSPAIIAAVGTNEMRSGSVRRVIVPWYPPKKKSRSRTIGPPSVPPNWLRSRPSSRRVPSGPTLANAFLALNRLSRRNSKALPWSVLVPDFVTALTEAPACIPFCAERPLVATLNSCSASGNGSGRFRLVFGSLCMAPSRRYDTPYEMPPATEMADPRWPAGLALPVWTAAPARSTRSVTLRPWSGSSTMRSFSTTSLMPELRTSTSGVAASTETVSASSPTWSDALITALASTWSTMPVCT